MLHFSKYSQPFNTGPCCSIIASTFPPTCTYPYLPCLCHHGGMPSFLLTCRTCILRTLLSRWSFLFSKIIMEPLQLLQARPTWQSWSSLMNVPCTPPPLRWWYNWSWQKIYYWMTSNYWWKQKLQSLLLSSVVLVWRFPGLLVLSLINTHNFVLV